jgi:glycosyltransferase involved in cell wall biosynthesis
LKNLPEKDMPEESENFKYRVLKGGKAWIIRKLTLHLILNPEKLDVFFSPSHYVPLFSKVPRICSIMDLGYLEFSGQFKKTDFWQLKLWTAYSIFVSKAIIAISNGTKKDIVRHYPFAQGKIHVTHLSFDDEVVDTKVITNDVRRIKNKYSIVGDYILYLGTLKPSKNIEGLIRAFRLLTMDSVLSTRVKLVITGKKGWLYEPIFALVRKLRLNKDVILTDFVPEKDKIVLLKGAKLFVLPSFWEGFGIDVVNAMAVGVPVVVSNRGSLPEIVGQAGIVIDPASLESIAQGLKKVLSMSDLEYNKLIKDGQSQAQKFSWEKTARKTMQLFERIKA